MSDKPILFISHSSKDGLIANVLKEQLEALLPIDVFETSHFDAIKGGDEWFNVITQKLDQAIALLVLVSFNSKYSEWVHWEIGYFYKRALQENLPIYLATIAGEPAFSTVKSKQTKSLNDSNQILSLLNTLADYVKQPIPDENWQTLVTRLLEITPLHISDESAIEKLRDFLNHEYKVDTWIDYGELDRKIGCPNGTSRSIKQVIETDNLSLEVKHENNSGIRLKKRSIKYRRIETKFTRTRRSEPY